ELLLHAEGVAGRGVAAEAAAARARLRREGAAVFGVALREPVKPRVGSDACLGRAVFRAFATKKDAFLFSIGNLPDSGGCFPSACGAASARSLQQGVRGGNHSFMNATQPAKATPP